MQHVLLKVFIILGIVIAAGVVINTTLSSAYASSPLGDALITVGIGTAAGTVIGLSTLPFYKAEEQNADNILLGAGAGFVAGLVMALYFYTTPTVDEEITPEELLPPKPESPTAPKENKTQQKTKFFRHHNKALLAMSPRPLMNMPLHVPAWNLSVNVLTLKF